MANNLVERAITAANQFTAPLRVGRNRKLNMSISSTAMSATVHLQRKPLGTPDASFVTIGTYTANAQKVIDSVGNWEYRVGVPTGAFTSATALNVQLLM